ncbi:MAG: hypothetical protein ACKVOT_06535 [Polaromonas sp.]
MLVPVFAAEPFDVAAVAFGGAALFGLQGSGGQAFGGFWLQPLGLQYAAALAADAAHHQGPGDGLPRLPL